jgi:solute carrier family 25 carnitine/acylcarnitine transporter 20/29
MIDEKNNLYKLLPGFFQGLTRVTISYPADVVKVQMQKQLFPNTYVTIKHILKNDMFKFYRGSSIAYITISLERSLQFYYLEKIQKKYNPFLSGFIVSVLSSIYNLPMQYLTTNIALIKKTDNISVNKFIKNTSIKSMYKGYFIETPKNILASTIFLGSYMKLRSMSENKTLYPFFGGLSGIMVWLLIYPLDTIKTELQTTMNINIKNTISERYKKYGIKSFYKGITPVLIRTFPSAFMGMYVYEKIRYILDIN